MKIPLWGIMWRCRSRLEGLHEHLLWDSSIGVPYVFRTKRAAQERIRKAYGYLRNRPDLRREPHCWRMPRAVRVLVTVDGEVKP